MIMNQELGSYYQQYYYESRTGKLLSDTRLK